MLGLVRQVDHMGRISIPTDFRSISRIYPKSTIEVHLLEDGNILIKPHSATCSLCGEVVHKENLGGIANSSKVCKSCKKELDRGDMG